MRGSKEVDDLSEIKQAILDACWSDKDSECDGGDTSDVANSLEQGHQSKPPLKSASFPSPTEDDDEIETCLRWIFSEDWVHSPSSPSISLPAPLKLVSALKGSREEQGLPRKESRVTWAPDVYDPPPTSVLHTVRGKKQHKSKKKNGKKGTTTRGAAVKATSTWAEAPPIQIGGMTINHSRFRPQETLMFLR